jgi:hypothetical protein
MLVLIVALYCVSICTMVYVSVYGGNGDVKKSWM